MPHAINNSLRVTLVQQGVWDTPLESLPLAIAYLKAAALQDQRLRGRVEITLLSCRGGDGPAHMAEQMLRAGVPDVLGFSVTGWNFQQFGAMAETFRQRSPDGWVIWGGTHVAHQADRVMRLFPEVDIVANGEGEHVFCELLAARLEGRSRRELSDIGGITFQGSAGELVTTPDRARIMDLDSIPSPFLTNAIDLTDDDGRFRFDVALMETTRGCPYKCSFCFWGGATGQKMRRFSRERLAAELDLFGRLGVETVVLCDSNFGMLPADVEFLEDFIAVRARYGYPRSLETSWAKNKSEVFYKLVRRMKEVGLRSSFTLALQTLTDEPLRGMRRRNMPVNDWAGLVAWLQDEGLDCYAELIWGAPGETIDSFIDGYDRLAVHVPRIATYPLLLLPNTEYSDARDEFGFTTVRGRSDDFEYVLAHDTMTLEENRDMQRFIIWARVVAENMVFRNLWRPLRELAGIRQSQVLWSLADFFDDVPSAAAASLRAKDVKLGEPDAVPRTLRALYAGGEIDELLRRWWRERMVGRVPAEHRPLLTAAFELDMLTRPVLDAPGAELQSAPVDADDGHRYYRRGPARLPLDALETLLGDDLGGTLDIEDGDDRDGLVRVSSWCRAGYDGYLDNHEMVPLFLGRSHQRQLEPSGATADAPA